MAQTCGNLGSPYATLHVEVKFELTSWGFADLRLRKPGPVSGIIVTRLDRKVSCDLRAFVSAEDPSSGTPRVMLRSQHPGPARCRSHNMLSACLDRPEALVSMVTKACFRRIAKLVGRSGPVNSEMNLVFVVPPRGATMGRAQGPHVDIQASSCATFSFFNSWHDVSGWLRTGCIEIWYPGSASSFDSAPGRISASSDGTNKLFPAYETNSHDCLDAPRMYRNLRQPFLPQRR